MHHRLAITSTFALNGAVFVAGAVNGAVGIAMNANGLAVEQHGRPADFSSLHPRGRGRVAVRGIAADARCA